MALILRFLLALIFLLLTKLQSLEFIPRPCIALMFLYPVTNVIYSFRFLMVNIFFKWKDDKQKEKERIEKEGQHLDKELYFVKQLVGNACGTIAGLQFHSNFLP